MAEEEGGKVTDSISFGVRVENEASGPAKMIESAIGKLAASFDTFAKRMEGSLRKSADVAHASFTNMEEDVEEFSGGSTRSFEEFQRNVAKSAERIGKKGAEIGKAFSPEALRSKEYLKAHRSVLKSFVDESVRAGVKVTDEIRRAAVAASATEIAEGVRRPTEVAETDVIASAAIGGAMGQVGSAREMEDLVRGQADEAERLIKAYKRAGEEVPTHLKVITSEMARLNREAEALRLVDVTSMPETFVSTTDKVRALEKELEKGVIDARKYGTEYAYAYRERVMRAIEDVREEHERFTGKQLPDSIKRAAKELDKLAQHPSKAALQSRVRNVSDFVRKIGEIDMHTISNLVTGALGFGLLKKMHNAYDEIYEAAAASSKVSLIGPRPTEELRTLKQELKLTTDELTGLNVGFARFAHLGPQSFRDAAETAVNLSRATGESMEREVAFTSSLQQHYGMTREELRNTSAATVVLAKKTGQAHGEVIDLYDQLKFTRFALDINAQSGAKLAEATAVAAGKMKQYGLESSAAVSDVQSVAEGGMDEFQKNMQTLIMSGMSPEAAMALMRDAAKGGEKGGAAIAELGERRGLARARMRADMERAGVDTAYLNNALNDITKDYLGDVSDIAKREALATKVSPTGVAEAKPVLTGVKDFSDLMVDASDAMKEFPSNAEKLRRSALAMDAGLAAGGKHLHWFGTRVADATALLGDLIGSILGGPGGGLIMTAMSLVTGISIAAGGFKLLKGLFGWGKTAEALTKGGLMARIFGGKAAQVAAQTAGQGGWGWGARAATTAATSTTASSVATISTAAAGASVAAVLAVGAVGLAVGILAGNWLRKTFPGIDRGIQKAIDRIAGKDEKKGLEKAENAGTSAGANLASVRAAREAGDLLKEAAAMESRRTAGAGVGIAALGKEKLSALAAEVANRKAAGEVNAHIGAVERALARENVKLPAVTETVPNVEAAKPVPTPTIASPPTSKVETAKPVPTPMIAPKLVPEKPKGTYASAPTPRTSGGYGAEIENIGIAKGIEEKIEKGDFGKQVEQWRPLAEKYAKKYGLPVEGVMAQIAQESGGRTEAVSGAGAQGLMQLMPGTAKELGLKGREAFDPEKNIEAGTRYMAQMVKMTKGDFSKASAGYNWGIGNVKSFERTGKDVKGRTGLPEETRGYVARVGKAYELAAAKERGQGIAPLRVPSTERIASRTPTPVEPAEPFTGMTQGDRRVEAGIRRVEGVLSQIAGQLRTNGSSSRHPSAAYVAMSNGETG